MVELGEDFSEEYFFSASKFIGKAFKGYTFRDLVEPDRAIEEIKNEYKKLFDVIYTMIKNYATGISDVDVVLEGSAKLLDQPEYANVEKAKAMLEFLETKEQLMPMVKNNSAPDDMRLNIRIGRAGDDEGSPECAVVTASYSLNGVNIGDAGVIGPIRMDYSKVVSVLDYIGKTISVLPESKNNKEDKED